MAIFFNELTEDEKYAREQVGILAVELVADMKRAQLDPSHWELLQVQVERIIGKETSVVWKDKS